MFKNEPVVLHLPRWYPNCTDVQSGVFIQKHIYSVGEPYKHVVVFAKSTNNRLGNPIVVSQNNNIVEIIVYFRESKHQWINTLKYILAIYKGIYKASKWFSKPTLIVAHAPFRTWLTAFIVSKIYGCPWVIFEHWSGYKMPYYIYRSNIQKRLFRYLTQKSNGVVTVSERLLHDMQNAGLPVRNKGKIIPNIIGFEPGNLNAFPTGQTPQILIVSDLVDKDKDLFALFEALNRVSQWQSFKLVVVGGGPDETQLREICNTGDLKERVTFVGRQNNANMPRFYENCAFYISNSPYETFGLAPVEALFYGKPIVCTKQGCPEIVINDQFGLFFESGDTHALEQAIKTMLATFRTYDSKTLHHRVKHLFSTEVVGGQIKAYYDSVVYNFEQKSTKRPLNDFTQLK